MPRVLSGDIAEAFTAGSEGSDDDDDDDDDSGDEGCGPVSEAAESEARAYRTALNLNLWVEHPSTQGGHLRVLCIFACTFPVPACRPCLPVAAPSACGATRGLLSSRTSRL